MAKGSQLVQLKSALSQAGLRGSQQPNSKKRKRTSSTSQQPDKDKKAARLKEIHERLNPFDIKVTKLKHDVGGRKIKGVGGRPAQSKQAGIEQRKKTLLKEYKEKGHVGGIVDRRFGENDPTMTPEERMLERFTRERQRASRGSAFNLEDEDELTHYGQSLSKLDDFDDTGLALSEDEEEARSQIDAATVKHAHFGGFSDDDSDEEQPERKKSKAEVMAEVIAKSKEHKALRQAVRETNDELRMQLDEQLDDIRDLLFAPEPSSLIPIEVETLGEKVAPASSGSVSGGLSTTTTLPSTSDAKSKGPSIEAKDAAFDQFVRELAFEARAKPKNRTKTEEEVAREEAERLQKQERRRIRRMNGEMDYDSEEEADKAKKKRAEARGGDDLNDDFEEDPHELGAGMEAEGPGESSQEEVLASEDEEDEESEDQEAGSEGYEESDVESGDDDEDADFNEDGEYEGLVSSNKVADITAPRGGKKELPYTFPCPESHDDLVELLEGVDDADVATVIHRLRTLYHSSLAEDNKNKLQVLTTILIDHILYAAAPPEPRFGVITSILSHLAALTRTYPLTAAQHFVSKLSLMEKNLKRGLAQGALDPSSKTFPGPSELALLRVIGVLWPTSDMHHAVVTPTRALMGAYMGLCRVRSLEDLASGLFLCTLWLQYERTAQRFVPESVNFAINTVLYIAPSEFKNAEQLPGSFPSPDFQASHVAGLQLKLKRSAQKESSIEAKPDLVALLMGKTDSQVAKLQLLLTALDVLKRQAEIYKGLDGFPELFSPVSDVLEGVHIDRLPSFLQIHLSDTRNIIKRLLKFAIQSRQPLLLQAHKPIPIPTYVPKFETSGGSSYIKNRDPDRERNEANKLRRQLKEEKKGAMRELRKDARFLASVQQQEQRERDRSYEERMRKVHGSIESERAEEKQMEREKAKLKKRAGKK